LLLDVTDCRLTKPVIPTEEELMQQEARIADIISALVVCV
jgi:hypothetical protein